MMVLDAAGIAQALQKMCAEICDRSGDGPFAVVGIRRGGEYLAQRLCKLIELRQKVTPPLGVVDITLYRDDGFGRQEWPIVGVTKIDFDLRRHTVVLVDDVLFTGRTVRAALEAILDYGRPRAVRLAVLIDRGLRELPISADAVGHVLATQSDDHIDVRLVEAGGASDAVLMEKRPVRSRAAAGKEA